MKKILISIFAAACMMPTTAQRYVLVNDEAPIPASEVQRITYGVDPQFESKLLPGRLASDPKTTLFSQALQLTGLADSLRAYWYPEYEAPSHDFYQYRSHVWAEVARYDERRYKQFTVFAETDDVFAAEGITNIEQLKAYAKQVYDAVYPEDASVTDPTNRRNSLNRFVAYHVLPEGLSYYYLTIYDGPQAVGLSLCVDRNLTDIAAWYETLMPHASLKCSYPDAGDETGLYLNRRGLKNGPDRYGKQIRGAMIVADGEKGFDHEGFNGFYYHIDRILTYDQNTRDNVLGDELWRVDFKTLSPDFMNDAPELRGNYLVDDDQQYPDRSWNPVNGRNIIYDWNSMTNITGDSSLYGKLVHRRAHCNFWSWQGDEVNLFGDFDMTIKLPPLPAGEWEIRLGHCPLETRPLVKVFLNGKEAIDTLDMRLDFYDANLLFKDQRIQSYILDYMAKNVFVVTRRDDSTFPFLVTDLKTGEQMITDVDPYSYNGPLKSVDYRTGGVRNFRGYDPTTMENLDWSQRATEYREQATKDYIATLPKVMKAPKAIRHFSSYGRVYSFFEEVAGTRVVLGRIVSDGKSDNYLRLQYCQKPKLTNSDEAMFDYFEFVPAAIADNTEIPEE